MTEAQALMEIAKAITRLSVAVDGIGLVLLFMLLFKKMGGKS